MTIPQHEEHALIQLCPDAMAPGARRVLGRAVIVFFLVAIFGGAAVDQIRPRPVVPPIGREKERDDRERAAARLSDGSLARVFEQDLRARSTIRWAVLPYYAAFLYEVFGDADPHRVVVGREGWMYLTARLRPRTRPTAALVDLPARCVGAFSRRLASAGTELVALVVPRKEELYDGFLRHQVYRTRPELYPALIAGLRREGVKAPDLATAFRRSGAQTFLKTDSHWTPAGVAIAAEEAARAGGILVPQERRATRLDGDVLVVTGDLLRIQGALRSDGTGPDRLRERVFTFKVVERPEAAAARRRAETAAPAYGLVGTSYTKNWDLLHLLLEHYADAPFWVRASAAVGPLEPLRSAADEFFATRPPKVLVWEVPGDEIFALGKTLEELGPIIAQVPDGGLSFVENLTDATPPLSSARGDLAIGRPRVVERSPFEARCDRDRIVQPNDGVLSVRFRGRVEGGVASVGVFSGSGHLEAPWPPGRASICLPIVGAEPGRSLRLAVLGGPGVSVTIEAVEILTDLDLASGVEGALPAADAPPAREVSLPFAARAPAGVRRAALVELDGVPAEAYPLSVSARGAAGPLAESSVEVSAGNPRGRHLVLIDLGAAEGAEASSITIAGRTAFAPSVVKRVRIAGPRSR